MIRTALRLATAAALSNGGAPPFPTLAGANIFDSRNDPLEDIAIGERRPVVVVRTEDDDWSHQSGSFTSSRTVLLRTIELIVEISVITSVRGDNGAVIAGWPATDASLEAWLDALELETDIALRGSGPWAMWYQNQGWGRQRWLSQPVYMEEERGNVRLAARTIKITMRAPGECLPKAISEDDVPALPALPSLLLGVFDRIAALGGGDLKIAAAQMRASLESRQLPAQPQYPIMKRTTITIQGLANG